MEGKTVECKGSEESKVTDEIVIWVLDCYIGV